MPWFSKNLLWRIVLICSLLSTFVLFSSLLKPWKTSNALVMFAQDLLYPVEYVWDFTSSGISSAWQHYIGLSKAAQENDLLKKKIIELSTLILNHDEQQHEITRLRDLLGFAQKFGQNQVSAEVIGGVRNDHFRAMRVSKGELDGVSVGMPVVTSGGVVGRVVRTGFKFSDVHLLADSNFYLDVLIQRTRVRGVLQGQFSNYCLLNLNQRTDVKIGDTIITAGILGGFPKGLPVGRVTRISYETGEVSQLITVEPWVNHLRTEEVVILLWNDVVVQKIIETEGRDWIDKSLGNTAKD